MKDLKIGYITTIDPMDRRAWSGTLFHLLEALRSAAGAVVILRAGGSLELFIARAFNFISTRLIGKRFNYRDSKFISKAYSRSLGKQLRGKDLDLLVAPAGLAAVAWLETRIPIVYINDRCLAGALGYHRILKDLFPFSQKDGLALEDR